VVFICLSCLYNVNAIDGEFASMATLLRRPAPLLRGSVVRRRNKKIRLSTAGVNDCAGFLHTLTTGFNSRALIVHIPGK